MQYDGREYYRAEGSARSSSTAHVPAQQCYEKRSQGINQRKILIKVNKFNHTRNT